MNDSKIKVLLVEPEKYPKEIVIDDSLEAMQEVVGGDIEEYMPYDDDVAIICNEESGVAEPSNISFVGDSDECGNYKVWIIAQEENNPHIIELTDRKKIDHMIILYWD